MLNTQNLSLVPSSPESKNSCVGHSESITGPIVTRVKEQLCWTLRIYHWSHRHQGQRTVVLNTQNLSLVPSSPGSKNSCVGHSESITGPIVTRVKVSVQHNCSLHKILLAIAGILVCCIAPKFRGAQYLRISVFKNSAKTIFADHGSVSTAIQYFNISWSLIFEVRCQSLKNVENMHLENLAP